MHMQDTVLFHDTIRYNMKYGRSTATDDEVIEAAKGTTQPSLSGMNHACGRQAVANSFCSLRKLQGLSL
eukprot:m.1143384 g.1143384  ORF g.1143384 m.1143384 type:complete len:69 (+) comp24457_c0_seq29:2624-2830(+)